MYHGNHTYITQTGFQNLKAKLNRLYKERVALGKELQDVKEPGRAQENSSYAALHDQTLQIESHMEQIQRTLQSAVLIKKPVHKHKVERGSTVKLKNGKDIKQFTLVGSLEADPSNGFVSDESPVGSQLLNAQVGDGIEIGDGHVATYTVLDIS